VIGMFGAVFASNMMFQKELYYPIYGWRLWLEYPLALTVFVISVVLVVLNFYLLHMLEKREFSRLSDDSKQLVRKMEGRLRIPVLILLVLIFSNHYFMDSVIKTILQVITVIMILILLFFEYRRRKFIKNSI
jgi:amino acid transporter